MICTFQGLHLYVQLAVVAGATAVLCFGMKAVVVIAECVSAAVLTMLSSSKPKPQPKEPKYR